MPSIGEDVVVLAGDIGTGVMRIEWAVHAFRGRPVVYVLGNHEFYRAGWDSLIVHARRAAAGTNVHVLEDDAVDIGGVRFLGATLWTDFELYGEDDCFVMCADPSDVPVQLRQFLLERDLGTALNLMRELQLTGRVVRHLEFVGADGEGANRIRQLSGLPVRCEARRNAIVMDLGAASTPLPTFDEHLVRVLEDQCRQLLERRQITGIAGRVRQQLLGGLGPVSGLGLVSGLNEVARTLNLSSRSLRRRLEDEGTSFRDLVEDTRRQLAEQMLGTTEMKLDELAVHLGYADTASFTRAFRRWYGVSPGQYRPRRVA